MEEQKLNAKVYRIHAEKLDEFGKKVDESLQEANVKIDEEALRVEDISKQVKQSIAQIDSLNEKMKYVQSIREPKKESEEQPIQDFKSPDKPEQSPTKKKSDSDEKEKKLTPLEE